MGNYGTTEIHRVPRAACEAFLEPLTGQGMLRLPKPSEDVHGLGMGFHAADYDAMVRELDRLGFEPTEGEDGGWCVDGMNRDGHEVIGLYGRHPIVSDPSIEQMVTASAALAEAVGLVR